MSAHSSPFMLEDLYSVPPSPVLTNSCFNDFDLFDCPIYPPSRSASPSRSQAPRLLKHQDSNSALTHAIGSSHTSTIARRSVHLGGKQLSPQPRKGHINWVRPIRLGSDQECRGDIGVALEEIESGVSLRLFGASMQRQRRLGRQAALSQSSSSVPASPTSSSNLDVNEPLTPSTQSEASPLLMTPPSRSQQVTHDSLKGLGVGNLFGDWSPRRQVTVVKDVFTAAKSDSADFYLARPVSAYSTSSSFSSSSLVRDQGHSGSSGSLATMMNASSPSNLEELQVLRKAARALEAEAKRPIRVGTGTRKVKRKAVPALLEEPSPIPDSGPRPSPRLASLPFFIPERQSSMASRAAGRPAPLPLMNASPRSSSDSDDSSMPSASFTSSETCGDGPITPGASVNAAQLFQMPLAFASQSYLLQVDAPSEIELCKGLPASQLSNALQRLHDTSPSKSNRRGLSRLTSHFSRSVL